MLNYSRKVIKIKYYWVGWCKYYVINLKYVALYYHIFSDWFWLYIQFIWIDKQKTHLLEWIKNTHLCNRKNLVYVFGDICPQTYFGWISKLSVE